MRWSYKTVRFGLKKEGLLGSAFLDESEIELSLNEFGKAGWELVSFMEVLDGLIGVFKQPLGRGIPLLEEDLTEEEEVESKPLPETPVMRKATLASSGDEGQVREPQLNKGLTQDEDRADDTDIGNIRIE